MSGEVSDTTIIERPKHPPPVNHPPVLPGHSGWESGAGPAAGENLPAKDRRPGPPAPAWIHPTQTSQWLNATPWIAATGALRDCPAALATCTNVAPNIGGFQARIAVTLLPRPTAQVLVRTTIELRNRRLPGSQKAINQTASQQVKVPEQRETTGPNLILQSDTVCCFSGLCFGVSTHRGFATP